MMGLRWVTGKKNEDVDIDGSRSRFGFHDCKTFSFLGIWLRVWDSTDWAPGAAKGVRRFTWYVGPEDTGEDDAYVFGVCDDLASAKGASVRALAVLLKRADGAVNAALEG